MYEENQPSGSFMVKYLIFFILWICMELDDHSQVTKETLLWSLMVQVKTSSLIATIKILVPIENQMKSIDAWFVAGARCFDHTERMWEERSCSQVIISQKVQSKNQILTLRQNLLEVKPNPNFARKSIWGQNQIIIIITIMMILIFLIITILFFIVMIILKMTMMIMIRCVSGSIGGAAVTTSPARSRGCTCRCPW